MKRTIRILAICLGVVAASCICHADDTDIYDLTHGVKPNVLLIFDNSGSMAEGLPYDDATVYPMAEPGNNKYVTDTLYERQCVRQWRWWCLDWDWVVYSGSFTDTNGDGIHDSDSGIRRGNRLNYDFSTQSNKLAVAQEAIKELIDLIKDHTRIGIMVLNGAVNVNTTMNFPAYHNDTTVLSSDYGGAIIEDRDDAAIETLKNQIDNMRANGGTPLTNRLINAAEYFRGNFGSWQSPINQTYWCRRNFVVLITDGRPEGEGNSLAANNNGDYDHIEDFMDANGVSRDYDGDSEDPDPDNIYINGGSDYLDDVAGYLYNDEDLRPDVENSQNLTTYTVGFTVDDFLLGNAALHGGGYYYPASNADELSQALRHALATIIEKTQTFTAPVVPVQKTTSGDKMYISLFSPRQDSNFWAGYLAKLGIASDGSIVAADGSPATDSEGKLQEHLLDPTRTPNPYWEAHTVLKNTDLSLRNIYTYLGSGLEAFSTSNSDITAAVLGNPVKQPSADPGTSARDDIINYVRGYDAYDEDVNSSYAHRRQYILGGILHSEPLIIDYSESQRVIYVGANDGMLHAFNDADGSEKWAFIPPDLLPKLKELVEGVGLQYFVDSSPKAYIVDNDRDGNIESGAGDRVIIIFGERRGGTSYTALDVTNPNSPQYLWRIDSTDTSGTYGIPPPTTVLSEMGQSWSEPEVGKIKVGGTDKVVAIIGGGYSSDNTKGRAVYVIDVLNGAQLKAFTVEDYVSMSYSIPSTVLVADTTFNGYINRVYVGDLGGRMWRFGLHRTNAEDTRTEDGEINNWTPRLLFVKDMGVAQHKIFYPPDLVLEPGYDYLYFGTGDRTDPTKTNVVNRLYAVKDRNETNDVFTQALTESDLVDVTSNVVQDNPGTEEALATLGNLNAQDGWYINMEGSGEKILAPPVVLFGMVLFTTFTPNSAPCSYGGDALFYAVGYRDGTAVLNLDTTNDTEEGVVLTKSDRSKFIGHGIPTQVVITISQTGDVRGYIGTGEYIVKIDLDVSVTLSLTAWREVF